MKKYSVLLAYPKGKKYFVMIIDVVLPNGFTVQILGQVTNEYASENFDSKEQTLLIAPEQLLSAQELPYCFLKLLWLR